MSFIIAQAQNKQADSFENSINNIQSKKPLNNKSSFSDSLGKAQKELSSGRTSSVDISRANSKNESLKTTNEEAVDFDNLESYGKNEKDLSQGQDENLQASSVVADKNISNDSNLKDIDEKKLAVHTDNLELLQLEIAVEQEMNTITSADLEALILQINSLIEQISTSGSFDEVLAQDIEGIANTLAELGLLFENALEVSSVSIDNSNVANINADIKNSIMMITESLRNMGENVALVENTQDENIELARELRLFANKVNEKLESENTNESTMTTTSDNKTFMSSLEAVREQNVEIKPLREQKLERDVQTSAQSSEVMPSDKATDFTIVKAKDGVLDIMDNPLNSKPNISSNQAASNISSSIDIMNKFQDMLARIVDTARLTMTDGKTDMIMSLRPEALGNVRMRMTVEGDNLHAKILVDSPEVKDIFTKNLDTIISALKEVNVNIEGFDVALSQNGDNASFGEEEGSEFSINGNNNSNIGLVDASIDDTVNIATQLFPERQLNIVI